MHQGLPVLSWHGDIDSDEIVDAIKAIEEVLFAHGVGSIVSSSLY